jgi:hypothetical protein
VYLFSIWFTGNTFIFDCRREKRVEVP